MKQSLYQFLNQLGVPRALAWMHRHKVVIVTYHGFTDRKHQGIQNYQGLHQNVADFRRHLEFLKRHYNVVSLEEVLEHYHQDGSLPPNPVVLTFDDGYRSNYKLAYPILREYDCPASIFLATRFVDEKELQWSDRLEYALDQAPLERIETLRGESRGALDPVEFRGAALVETKAELKRIPQEGRPAAVQEMEDQLGCSLRTADEIPDIYQPLEWSEIREMVSSRLVSIGSHSASHFIISRCTPEVMREELTTAKRLIETRTGVECPLFCYPNGARGDFDDRSRAILAELGHTCGLTTVEGLNDGQADVYQLKRVGVMDGRSLEEFVMAVVGVSRWVTGAGDGLRRLGLRG